MPTWILYTVGILALIVLVIFFIKQRQSQEPGPRHASERAR